MDAERFIRANMRLAPVPLVPEIRLYTAHAASGLRRLVDPDEEDCDPPPPYWAYPWAGGAALARHFLDCPWTVAGRRALDLGAGSGIVGIAAARAGALEVIAAEIDRNAIAALSLNAEANDVVVKIIEHDLTAGPPPLVDLVAVGDLFYEQRLADRVTGFLDRCVAGGIEVLVGDLGRAHLPRARLERVAEYSVLDFADGPRAAAKSGGVFSFQG